MAASTAIAPAHPGEILAEEFLTPLGISQNRLGDALERIQPLPAAS